MTTGRHTFDELDALPRLAQGHAADLKIDNGDGVRVWLSRMTRADGAEHDHAVEVEHYDGGRWSLVDTYPSHPEA